VAELTSARRHLLAAPDKFRGSASAPDVAAAVATAARRAGWSCDEVPLADGGEGTLDAFGGANRTTTVTGPLGTPVEAEWRMGPDGVAVVESARASGLLLAGGKEHNDPVGATSRGTGELVAAAIEEGAREVVVSLGGSATTDGGTGAVAALAHLAPFGTEGRPRVLVACDVRTVFCDAARVFGPQKGATPEQIEMLGRRLDEQAEQYRERFGIDVRTIEGGGAAGGLGGGFAVLGAQLVPGFELIASHVDLERRVQGASAVVTGEGKLDAESFNGKVVGGVVDIARRHGVPVLVVAGDVDAGVAGRVPAVSLLESFGSDAAWGDPLGCVTTAVERRLMEGISTW
jgi:glycerate kinase